LGDFYFDPKIFKPAGFIIQPEKVSKLPPGESV